MNLIDEIIAHAQADRQRIVLPEGTEARTLAAAERLIEDNIAEIVLLGNPEEIRATAGTLGLKNIGKATIFNPVNDGKKQVYIDLLLQLRRSKGLTPEKAVQLVEDSLYFACLMIKAGDADGEVAGALNTTGNVLRPALQIIKTMPGITCVSGAFLMFTNNKAFGEDGVLLFADCAVKPEPTASELAQIAVASGQTARSLLNVEPRIAMLSFSTKGSASHETIDKIVEATRLAKEMEPGLMIDGELQADAAIVESIAVKKAPGSTVAGKANVLIFPSVESGNICYKLVERIAGIEAIGPILQGMAAPVNDLSRGCSVDDIYKLVVITANQSIALKKK